MISGCHNFGDIGIKVTYDVTGVKTSTHLSLRNKYYVNIRIMVPKFVISVIYNSSYSFTCPKYC